MVEISFKGIHTKYFFTFILSLFLFASCSSQTSIAATNSVQDEFNSIRTELYCGLSKPDGRTVTAAEWQIFLNEIVTPVFKEGYSVFTAEGRWMDTRTSRTITENTKVLVFIYKPNAAVSSAVDRIIRIYKRKFQQQAVMRVDYRVSARF